MKLFFVDARIEKHNYESGTETFEYRNVIWANNLAEAEKKLEKYWTNQDEEYSHTYWILHSRIEEAIQ